ncbi:Flagellar motor rotation protein MotA [hydrothermal vent metagenome]|uniref:Flagellar motor rotation protein MotA n=1 Tax=hydrothermal vent metagenome TaxID=652676 RepID=A0A3B1CRM5_9ZZZZ
MTTFLGIVSGVGLLFYAIVMQGGVEIFWSVPSLMIVLGGTGAAIFISCPLPKVMRVSTVLIQIFKKEIQQPSWVIKLMVELAFKARQKSLLSLESDINRIDNRFVKLGLEMVIDGQPSSMIRDVLDTELDFVQVRHRSGEHIFRAAARFAPSFGLIGTLIGLVAMLRSIGGDNTASLIGQGMAVALITTFYGAMISNLFFTPIAEKLRSRSEDEMLVNRIIIEGVLLIQGGVNPRIIERKLNSFLPPEMRSAYYDKILKANRRKATQA